MRGKHPHAQPVVRVRVREVRGGREQVHCGGNGWLIINFINHESHPAACRRRCGAGHFARTSFACDRTGLGQVQYHELRRRSNSGASEKQESGGAARASTRVWPQMRFDGAATRMWEGLGSRALNSESSSYPCMVVPNARRCLLAVRGRGSRNRTRGGLP